MCVRHANGTDDSEWLAVAETVFNQIILVEESVLQIEFRTNIEMIEHF